MTVAREFRAEDVYPLWRNRVRAAQESVRVYTPYLNRIVVDLLKHAPAGNVEKSVITDLSPTNSAVTYRDQLVAVRRLLKEGIEVRTQPRLHAKVLLVDGAQVTVGSQNFTSYARSSREATVVPVVDLAGSAFAAKLDEWHDTATEVTAEFVNQLIANLAPAAREVKDAADTLLRLYDAEEKGWQERQRAERERLARQRRVPQRMASAASASPYRPPTGPAWAKLAWVHSGYHTLAAGWHDLTSWPHEDRRRKTITLEPLLLHPILIDPGQMAYARVSQHRITYLWSGFRRVAMVRVGSRWVRFSLTFPKEDFAESNIHLKVESPWSRQSVTAHFLLDGVDLSQTSVERSYGRSDDELADEVTAAFNDKKLRRHITDAIFKPFHPSRLGIDNHNAPEYFERGTSYRIDALRYDDYPVLLATSLDAWRSAQSQQQ